MFFTICSDPQMNGRVRAMKQALSFSSCDELESVDVEQESDSESEPETETVDAKSTQINEMFNDFISTWESIPDGVDLLTAALTLEQLQTKIGDICNELKAMVTQKLKMAFRNSVNKRKHPATKPLQDSKLYRIAMSYPYEIYHVKTGKYLTPHVGKEYPTISYTIPDPDKPDKKKTRTVGVHTVIAENFGSVKRPPEVPFGTLPKGYDVDHIHQVKYDWRTSELAVKSSKENQRNRKSAEFIEPDEVAELELIQCQTYNDEDISDEQLYMFQTSPDDEFQFVTLEDDGRYRMCPINNGKVSARTNSRTTFSVNILREENLNRFINPDEVANLNLIQCQKCGKKKNIRSEQLYMFQTSPVDEFQFVTLEADGRYRICPIKDGNITSRTNSRVKYSVQQLLEDNPYIVDESELFSEF